MELWGRIYSAVVVKVSSGLIRGAVERVRGPRERQKVRLAGVVIPGLQMGRLAALGVRDSTIDALAGSRSRALRLIRDSWCLGGLMMESRALRADIRAHFWREKIRLTVEK